MFAWEHAGVEPDIMLIGKGLTAGYMTMSAVLATKDVADTISRGEAGVMMHYLTFMGNPLACAVAVASLRLLMSQDMKARIEHLNEVITRVIEPARSLPGVTDVRTIGAIGVIETEKPVNVGDFQKQCVRKGIWVRPFGRNVYVMPPYIISDDDLTHLIKSTIEILTERQDI